jgi:hypothetical protein
MRNRYRSRFNAAGIFFAVVLLLIGAIVFVLIDSVSGTLVAIDETPGVISDLYKTSYLRTINAGKTKTYYTDIDYMAEVVVGNKVQQVEITEREYWQYEIGMDVILVTYTTEGGISKSNYYAYGIKAFD